jgi:hypothetical protein
MSVLLFNTRYHAILHDFVRSRRSIPRETAAFGTSWLSAAPFRAFRRAF